MDKKNYDIGSYKNDELHLEVRENLKEGESLSNIKVNDNGTITFAGKTYKINLIHLKTGEKLQGNLSAKDKREIAQNIKNILAEKPHFFSKSKTAPSLNNVLLADKRWFHYGVERGKHFYTKGVEYNDKQKKIFNQIQKKVTSHLDSSLKISSFVSQSPHKISPFIPTHPLDVVTESKDEYKFTPLKENATEKDRSFPQKFLSTTNKIWSMDKRFDEDKNDIGVEFESIEKQQFFPDFKPARKGLGIIAPFFKYMNGTSDKYSGYTKEEFLKSVINDLGDNLDEHIERLEVIKDELKDEQEHYKLIEEGLHILMELKQQIDLLNDPSTLEVYKIKYMDFQNALEDLNVSSEQKQLLKAVAPQNMDVEEEMDEPWKEIEKPSSSKKEEEFEMETNPQNEGDLFESIYLSEEELILPSNSEYTPFDKACDSLEKLIQHANIPGHKIGIVDGQAVIVRRNKGISSRKANSDSAELIVKNLLDKIDFLANIAEKTENINNQQGIMQKRIMQQRIRDLLSQMRGIDGWLDEVCNNFPSIVERIEEIRNKVPEPLGENFQLEDAIELIINQNSHKRESYLFTGLPELNKHLELLTVMTERIKEKKKPLNEEQLKRVQDFIIAWIEHYKKYHATDDALVEHFSKAIVALSEKLTTENNKLLIEILKKLEITFNQEGNRPEIGKISGLTSIPLIPDRNIEDGQEKISGLFQKVKNEKHNNKQIKEFANDIFMANAYYLSKVKQNELTNLAWSKKDKSEKAPNVVAMTNQFNKVSNFVVNQIVECKNAEEAKRMIKFFIDVANQLIKQKDYFGFAQISSALSTANVLKTINNIVESNTISKNIEKWDSLFEKNYKEFRNLADHAIEEKIPFIPFICLYLTDLTFNAELSNQVETNEAVNINAKKMGIASKAIYNNIKALDNDKRDIFKLNSDFFTVIQNYPIVQDKDLDFKYNQLKVAVEKK